MTSSWNGALLRQRGVLCKLRAWVEWWFPWIICPRVRYVQELDTEVHRFPTFKECALKSKLLLCLESQSCQMTLCWSTQVKGCLAKVNTWKNIFLKQVQLKGCFTIVNMWKDAWWRSIPQSVGEGALVWFAPPTCSLLRIYIYNIALRSIVKLPLW